MSITPVPGLVDQITTGGTAVVALPGNISGGFIQNPYSPSDSGVAAEPLYINPTGAAAVLEGNGTTFALQPGETWNIVPGQTTSTSVNAATSGHKFAVVYWP